MGKIFRVLWLFLIALTIFGCSNGGSSNGSSGGAVSLGTLPNGATVYISSSSFTASSSESTSGTLSIAGGTPGESYTFSFGITPVTSPAPTVSSAPNPCVMTSGNTSASCQLNFIGNGAPESTYTVAVSYESSGSSTQIPLSPGTFTFIVTGGNTPVVESGILVIMPLSVESIESGSTTTATVSLSGSQGITSSSPVVVSVWSNESAIMSVSSASCSLYTAVPHNSCTITLTGESAGTATFSVIANGYAESTSGSLIINPLPPPPPGLFITPLLESTGIESNGATYALISRSGSTAQAATISLSSNTPAMSVQSSLSLTAGESSAYVLLTGVSPVGSATLTATDTADNYTESTLTFSITAAPVFSCVADISGSTPTLCGCLNENDGSGLIWYADMSQSDTWTNWCTPSLALNGGCTTTGPALVTFNAAGHCGFNDWHLPTMSATPSGNVNAAGGNWGALGTFALANGYFSGNSLQTWMNGVGFSGTCASGFCWSSVSSAVGLSNAWVVLMGNGFVSTDNQSSTGGVVLVRGGQ